MVLEENRKGKMVGKRNNEEVLECTGEIRSLPNRILRRKANWVGRILGRNCFLNRADDRSERSSKKKKAAPIFNSN